ncbi:MAG: MipA/OmpV family protein [Sphingomonadales bacterium]|nr:MipA/OmpV family protein [Sphingomonadales bacterium]
MIQKGTVSLQRLVPTVLATCIACATPPAIAQSGPGARGGGDTVTLGVGMAVTASYQGASDYRIIPGGVLQGTIKGHDFRLNGLQLFVDALPNDARRRFDLELGPVVGVNFNRSGDVSDPRVAALGKRDKAVELGVRGAIGLRGIAHRADKLALAVTGSWDVADAHRSHVISPSLEYSTRAGRRTFLRAALNAEFVGKRYADYYFGIDAAGAVASGLGVWKPGGGLYSVGGNVLATHSLSSRRSGWSLFGIAGYKRLQGDIAASPIVRDTGSPNQGFASAGLAYTF